MSLENALNVSRGKNVVTSQNPLPLSVPVTIYTDILKLDPVGTDNTVFTLNNSGSSPATFASSSTFGALTNNPVGLVVDQLSQNRYITDGNVVKVFDSSDSLINTIQSSDFNQLEGIRIFNNTLYLVDSAANKIHVLNLDGSNIRDFGVAVLDTPSDIAVDSNGFFYVCDLNGNINVFDRTFLHYKLISTGFTSIPTIAINSKDIIYVSDQANDTVHLYSTKGEQLSNFGSNGTADGEFDVPRYITIKRNGDLIISDFNNDRIQVFTPKGVFIYKIASITNTPVGVDYDYTDDEFIVAESTNKQGRAISISTSVSGVVSYKVFGSSKRGSDFSNVDSNEWVNLLSIRDIEAGNSTVYSHTFIIDLPISSRVYESFSNSWKNVWVLATSTTNVSTLASNSRSQS